MKNKILLGFRLLVILSFCISLFGQQITIVKGDLKGGGTISGIVTYTGTITSPHEIFVSIHLSVDEPPEHSEQILSGETYSITEIPDGTYYIYAFLDANDSGGGPPDPGEPGGWYADGAGQPLAINIIGGNTVDDIDIVLEDTEENFCTWDGSESTDWHTAGNWSCDSVPTELVNTIIPDVTNDPIISSLIEVNAITVENGAVLTCNNPEWIYPDTLTIDAGGSMVSLGFTAIQATTITNNGTLTADKTEIPGYAFLNLRSTTFSNGGTIQLLGDSNSAITIYPESEFNNSGTVLIDAGNITISGIGTHSGEFSGSAGTSIIFDKYGTTEGQTVTFEENSVLDVPAIGIGTIVNFSGDFGGDNPFFENKLGVNDDGIFHFKSDSVITNLDRIEINSGGEVINDHPNHLQIKELIIHPDDNVFITALQNNGSLEILDNFEWQGILRGTGMTEIAETSSVFLQWKYDPIVLDGHHLINQTTFTWYGVELVLSNGATFTNNGTFNAYEDSTMSGGSDGRFINNGLFRKYGTGTTTTINTDFEKNGVVNIVAGNLLFTGNLIYGNDITLELGSGTFDTGETLILEPGAMLVGSGTLSSNLVNGGTVSPGSSPGIINVDGNYTQESSGVLEIELGGDVAGTGFDQLQISGAATLAGSLNISLIDEFVPSKGDTFEIITSTSLTGTFGENDNNISWPSLPAPLKWDIQYNESPGSVTISVIDGGGVINGTVTYTGTTYTGQEITIGLHTSIVEPPIASIDKLSGIPYSFEDLDEGTYYISAFIDANDSGGEPDPGEPFSWYVVQDGEPEPIVISDGNTVNAVNIDLEDNAVETGTINGTVTYTGNITTTGDIIVSIHESTSGDQSPIRTSIADGTGAYSFDNLSDGTYYVAAFLDVNDSGDGPPDDGEPFSWYVDQDGEPQAIIISGGNTVNDIDITLQDVGFSIFLPLITR